METYVTGNGWRNGDDQPVGRHRMTNDSGATARLHTDLRDEPVRRQLTMERPQAHPLSRLVQPVGASKVSRTLLDAALMDLLD